jgi:MFS family permease
MYSYLGLAVGDLSNGVISQLLKSRKKVVLMSILLTFVFILLYLFSPFKSVTFFYVTCFLLGFGIGYWALFVTIAAEQFGTDIRSTVATTVPNFIRGTVVPITLGFKFLRDEIGVMYGLESGLIYGALIIGMLTIIIALFALRIIPETFSKDLNYIEE